MVNYEKIFLTISAVLFCLLGFSANPDGKVKINFSGATRFAATDKDGERLSDQSRTSQFCCYFNLT